MIINSSVGGERRRGRQGRGDELEQYLADAPLEQSESTALDWWVRPEQRRRFPNLSRMVIDIFSIPAMSSEPERVFSQVKYTLDKQRSRKKALTLEITECLKSWFRIGIFTQEDLHLILKQEQQEID